jgi:hypothetical protein
MTNGANCCLVGKAGPRIVHRVDESENPDFENPDLSP